MHTHRPLRAPVILLAFETFTCFYFPYCKLHSKSCDKLSKRKLLPKILIWRVPVIAVVVGSVQFMTSTFFFFFFWHNYNCKDYKKFGRQQLFSGKCETVVLVWWTSKQTTTSLTEEILQAITVGFSNLLIPELSEWLFMLWLNIPQRNLDSIILYG